MLIEWLIDHPLLCGLITIMLMGIDWLLTIAQENERQKHYFRHYQSYPINTLEGNPALQNAVNQKKVIYSRHLIAGLIVGTIVGLAVAWIPDQWGDLLLGYVWGIFLIVIMQHLSNLIGYYAGRKGIHGQLWIHQRTSYLIQAGRYFSITVFFLVLSILSPSHFIYGVTIAALSSTIRQLKWMKTVPMIGPDDDDEYDKSISNHPSDENRQS